MFRRWPFFQRLLSWTKPYAPVARHPRLRALRLEQPDPRADEHRARSSRADGRHVLLPVAARDGGRRSTPSPSGPGSPSATAAAGPRPARPDDGRSCSRRPTASTAPGRWCSRSASPSRGSPTTPGIELAAHYADTRPVETYADKRVFIIGKQNSGFELATGLLPGRSGSSSPRPRPAAAVRPDPVARRHPGALRAAVRGPRPGRRRRHPGRVDRADRARRRRGRLPGRHPAPSDNGRDDRRGRRGDRRDRLRGARCGTCPTLGVATFGQSRLPAQTPFWESTTVPGHLLRRDDQPGLGRPEEARHPVQLGRRPRRPLQRPGPGPPHRHDPLRGHGRPAGPRAGERARASCSGS